MNISRERLKEIILQEYRLLKEEEQDDEVGMAKSQLYSLIQDAQQLHDLFSNGEELPSWVQAKITKAADYIRAAANHEEYEEYEGDE